MQCFVAYGQNVGNNKSSICFTTYFQKLNVLNPVKYNSEL